jgi:Flp pilus assembly protein TadD
MLTLALVAVYSLTVIGFFVTGRYRVPMVPFFAIGASVAVVSVWDLLRNRSFARAALTVVIAVCVVAVLRPDYLGVRAATRGFAALTIAQDRLDTGDLGGAIAELEKIRREGSVRASEVYSTLARAYVKRGSPEDREAAFRVAEDGLKEYPGEAELLWYSAVGHATRRDWAMAERRIASLVEVNPQDMRALYLGFTATLELGDTTKARAYLDRAIAVDADHEVVGQMRSRLEEPLSQ